MSSPPYHVLIVFTQDREARLFGSYWSEDEARRAADEEQEFWGYQAVVVVMAESYERAA